MKKVILALMLAAGSVGFAHADADVVKDMVSAYKKGKNNAMKEEEETCWSAFKPGDSDTAFGYCATHSFVGHLIADMVAEKGGKKLTGYWAENTMQERVAKHALRLKMSEKQIEKLIKEYVEDSAEEIVKALQKSGYTY